MSELETTPTIKSSRKGRGMTQADLAATVGVARQTIISIERGDYAPSVYLALKIARTLGHTVEELFPLKEES